MQKQALKKIIILGDAGRGKTTFARKLSEKLNLPFHSTDDYFYEVKFTKRRDKQESIDLISKNFLHDRWIVEGTTRHLLEPGLHLADLIIHLRHTNIFSQWYVIFKRSLTRKHESILDTLSLMKHVFYKRYQLGNKRGTTTHKQLITPYKDRVITLSSFKQIDDFLASL